MKQTSPTTRHQLFLLLFLLLLPAICLGQPTTASTDPYQILRQHYESIGGLERLQALKSTFSEGQVRNDALVGTFKLWGAPPLRYRLTEDFGIISRNYGDDGNQNWQQDENGQILIDRDPETEKRRQIAKRLDHYEHRDKNSPVFSLHYLGISTVGAHSCYKIELTNRINHDISELFIATDSLLLVRTVTRQPDFTQRTDYADFRTVDGLLLPYYEKTLTLPWNNEEEIRVERYQIDPPISDEMFTTPQKSADDFHFATGQSTATVPFEFIENIIHLPVTIGAETRLWTLDSGASKSVIDADYAKKLGLTAHGMIRGHGFGEQFNLSFAELPAYRVGDLRFNPQKIYLSTGLAERSYEPVVAGILGYDFLSRFVVEIDYAHKLIHFHDPESFNYNGDGQVFFAPLKYRTFQLPVALEDKTAGPWSLDLGAHNSSLVYHFAQQNNLLSRAGVEAVSQGFSGIAFGQIVQFSKLSIGNFSLPQPRLNIPEQKGAGASAVAEIDGYLGNSELRRFHIFLDYPRQRVILEAGPDFHTDFPRDRSGMLIGMAENGQPMVSFVARQTPAQLAGFVAGDMIEQVNDKPVSEYQGIIALRKLLRQAPNTQHRFMIRRDGQLLELDISLKELTGSHPRQPATKEI